MTQLVRRALSVEDYRSGLLKRFAGTHLCETDQAGKDSSRRYARIEAFLAAAGMATRDARPYQVAEGVALIDVTGVLSSDPEWWDETDYGDIESDARAAAADPEVNAILMRINSPGGSSERLFETAMALQQVGETKPLWCVADSMAYSAAYLLATTAEKIYVPPVTGGVGSVGVYSTHMDVSGYLQKQGVKVTLISAGAGKTDGTPYEPLSDSARTKIQGEVDRLYDAFVMAVSASREMTPDAVRAMGAALFRGSQQSIGAGLADATGSLEQAWADLVAATKTPKTFSFPAAAAASSHKEGSSMADNRQPPAEATAPTAAEIESMVTQARNEGFAAASEIADLCALAGASNRVTEFVSARKTAAEVRTALLAQRASGQKDLSTAVMPGTDGAAGDPAPKARPWVEVLKSMGCYKGGR